MPPHLGASRSKNPWGRTRPRSGPIVPIPIDECATATPHNWRLPLRARQEASSLRVGTRWSSPIAARLLTRLDANQAHCRQGPWRQRSPWRARRRLPPEPINQKPLCKAQRKDSQFLASRGRVRDCQIRMVLERFPDSGLILGLGGAPECRHDEVRTRGGVCSWRAATGRRTSRCDCCHYRRRRRFRSHPYPPLKVHIARWWRPRWWRRSMPSRTCHCCRTSGCGC